MTDKMIYEFPILSSRCVEDPVIEFRDMDMFIRLKGYSSDGALSSLCLHFTRVICQKSTAIRFACYHKAADALVELLDSAWLNDLRQKNEQEFNYWKPRHFAVELEDIGGLWEIIAQSVEIDFQNIK